jgi:hypothetical protein
LVGVLSFVKPARAREQRRQVRQSAARPRLALGLDGTLIGDLRLVQTPQLLLKLPDLDQRLGDLIGTANLNRVLVGGQRTLAFPLVIEQQSVEDERLSQRLALSQINRLLIRSRRGRVVVLLPPQQMAQAGKSTSFRLAIADLDRAAKGGLGPLNVIRLEPLLSKLDQLGRRHRFHRQDDTATVRCGSWCTRGVIRVVLCVLACSESWAALLAARTTRLPPQREAGIESD